ncbi:hypothetical protein [Natronomonas sp. LN261]|uniref:hypothetical protein n=1 Tax=Natronomonas sp. LN261 TaxID=2750669 RepID=UPI0015EFD9B1|nr:hypothetical protein [Natronomonas sp. LN261]
MSNDDWISLAQKVRGSGNFEEGDSLVEVIESVLRERLDVEEASASEEEIRAKQEELRENITGNSRESEAVEPDDVDRGLSEAELKREELRSKIHGSK